MYDRCYNPNNRNYPNYGAIGITITDEWLGINGFSLFLEYVGKLDNCGVKGFSLDRIDPLGDYTPGNLRWATSHQQNGNKRNSNRFVGVYQTTTPGTWCAQFKLNRKRYARNFKNLDDAIRQRQEWELQFLGKLLT